MISALATAAEAKTRVGFANVSVDAEASTAAISTLREKVDADDRLEPLGEGAARFALEEPIDPATNPEAEAVRRAAARLDAARAAYARFEHDDAIDEIRQADQVLRGVAPTPEVVKALADINLLAGVIHVARGDDARATTSFQIVRRLDPERTALDRREYRPHVVSLYDKAAVAAAGKVKVRVTSEPPDAVIWLDGREVSVTPATLEVDLGEHYVAVTLEGHAARHEKIKAGGGELELSLLLSRLPAEQRARAVRTGLMRPNLADAAWVRAAAALADIASLDAVVFVRDGDGGLEAAVYDARKRTLGAWTPVADDAALVAAIPRAAVPQIALPDEREQPPAFRFDEPPPVEEPRPWYRTAWGTTVIVGAALVVGSSILFVALPDGTSEPPALRGLVLDGGWQ